MSSAGGVSCSGYRRARYSGRVGWASVYIAGEWAEKLEHTRGSCLCKYREARLYDLLFQILETVENQADGGCVYWGVLSL